MAKNKKQIKTSSSKTYTNIAIIQFVIIILYSMYLGISGGDTSMLAYLIPASAGILGVALAFYYNKSKSENLSKQRIRYVYLKMLLQDKISPEIYEEIEEEISNIDEIINNKLYYSLQESVNEDINNDI